MSTVDQAPAREGAGTSYHATEAPPALWIRGGIAGLLGATVLALWFLVVDSALGEPFRVPGILANSLLGVEGLEAGTGMIAIYSFVHYATFMVVGVVVTRLCTVSDSVPSTSRGCLGLCAV